MTNNITKQGAQPLAFTNWQLAQTYNAGEAVIKDNDLYFANATIPVNTPFVVGTTGATWTLAVQGYETTRIPEIKISAAPSNGFGRLHAYGNRIFRAGSNDGTWLHGIGMPSILRSSVELMVDGTPPDSWVKIQDTSSAFYGLGSDGALYVAGHNTTGQLGIGGIAGDIDSNIYPFIFKNTHPALYGPGIEVVDFWAGFTLNNQMVGRIGCCWVQVNDNGTLKLYSFGMNTWGSIGNGNGAGGSTNSAFQMTPFEHVQLRNNPVRTVTTWGFRDTVPNASAFTGVVTMSGQLWTCGVNWGQLGLGTVQTANPVLRRAMTSATTYIENVVDFQFAIQIGTASVSFALCSDGTVWATGQNPNGRLGVGDTTDRIYYTPVLTAPNTPLTGIKKIQAVIAGLLALNNSGEVWATGSNWDYHWGNGESSGFQSSYYAKMKQGNIKNFWLAGTGWGYIAAYYLDNNNVLRAAGSNAFYQLGTIGTDGTNTNAGSYVQTPAKVGLPDGEYPVALKHMGGYYNGAYIGGGVLMLSNTNKLYTWGYLNLDVSGVKNLKGTRFPHLINDFYDPFDL